MVKAPRRSLRGLVAALLALAVATLVLAAVGAAQPSTGPTTTVPTSGAPTTSATPTTTGLLPTATTTPATTTAAPTTTDTGGGGDCNGHIRIPGTDWCTPIPNSVQSAAGDAVSSFFSDIVDQVLRGFIWIIKYAWQLFVHVDINASSSQGTLQKVNDMTGELQVLACGLGLLIALLQILFQRMMLTGDNAAPEAFGGFVRWALAATLAAPTLLALAGASDALAEWLFTTSANQAGGTTHIVDKLSSALSGRDARLKTEDVISLALALLGLIAYLELTIQLVLQKAWLIYVAAGLPIAGAASVTGGGKAVFWSMVRLGVGVLLFKPIAALLFAVAFWQIGDLNSGSDVVTAVLAMVAPAFCLPVLTRLVGNTAVAYSGAPMLAGTYRRARGIGRMAGAVTGGGRGRAGDGTSGEGESSRRDDKAKTPPSTGNPPSPSTGTGTATGKAGPAPAPSQTGTNTTLTRSTNTAGTTTSTRGGATAGGTTGSASTNGANGSSSRNGAPASSTGSTGSATRSGSGQSGRASVSTSGSRTSGNHPAAPPPTSGSGTGAARSGDRSDPNSGPSRATAEQTPPAPAPTPARTDRARRRTGPRDSSFRRIT
ncbi:hypothetical protein ACIRRA_39915 [Nocardia sp. NPDC101769]|uniref:hypothetical protein n=1 Tax=Nocardia sp. NPDC101769 TaxID=3364333 RepID=UPI003804468B